MFLTEEFETIEQIQARTGATVDQILDEIRLGLRKHTVNMLLGKTENKFRLEEWTIN